MSSPIIEVMGWRLIEEGCSVYPDGPDFQWSEDDRKSYAKWQRKLGFDGQRRGRHAGACSRGSVSMCPPST